MKKLISLLLALSFAVAKPALAQNKFDVNGDGKVNAVDALVVLTRVVNASPYQAKFDVNGSGKVDTQDVIDILNAAKAVPVPTPTIIPTQPAPTLVVAPTLTPIPTVAQATPTVPATPIPAPTVVAATVTPVVADSCAGRNCVDINTIDHRPLVVPNLAGQACPKWVHDSYLTSVQVGTNLVYYRTWHPAVDPETKCNFDHEHSFGPGVSPTQSLALNTMPAYGWEADQHGMLEPHNGFKTAWVNAGDCNQLEGFCSTSHIRLTVHMGTAGQGRIDQRMHTFAFDMVGAGPNAGAEIHVRGMADTGSPTTQCAPAPDTSGPSGFRILGMPKDQALACSITGPYEVWQFHLLVGGTVIGSKFATFDGKTVARQSGNTFTLEPTDKTWENGPFNGCKSDVYFGGSYLSTDENFTDMFGRQIIQRGPKGPQLILDTVGKNTYKRPFDNCVEGVNYISN